MPNVNKDAGACSLLPLAIMVRTLSPTLCGQMPSRIHPMAVQVLPLRKARPPSTATLHQPKRSQTTCITQGAVKEREAGADASLPGEWPIYKLNNSQRGAGGTRVTTVIGDTSTSGSSVSQCPERRQARKQITINLEHHLPSTLLFKKHCL